MPASSCSLMTASINTVFITTQAQYPAASRLLPLLQLHGCPTIMASQLFHHHSLTAISSLRLHDYPIITAPQPFHHPCHVEATSPTLHPHCKLLKACHWVVMVLMQTKTHLGYMTPVLLPGFEVAGETQAKHYALSL